MSEETLTWTSWIEGPRWAKAGNAIRKGAINYGLTLVSFSEDKTMFRTTTYFTVEGKRSSVIAFGAEIQQAVKDWNG